MKTTELTGSSTTMSSSPSTTQTTRTSMPTTTQNEKGSSTSKITTSKLDSTPSVTTLPANPTTTKNDKVSPTSKITTSKLVSSPNPTSLPANPNTVITHGTTGTVTGSASTTSGQTINTDRTVATETGTVTTTKMESTVEATTDMNAAMTTSTMRASTTRDPLITDCNVACPDGFYEGATFCIQVVPSMYSHSYSDALTYCQRSDHLDLMDGGEMQLNLESINDMAYDCTLHSSLLYVNERGSAFVRKNRTVRVLALNITTRFTLEVANRVGFSDKHDGLLGLCRIT
ncbi:hypothetical protein PENTCL1PPCAC_21819, partial [Pristionchus entomophagus]